jgi:hypothetical protein
MRFTVPGWPSSVLGHSAVTPHMNRLAGSGARQYKDGVTGQPGTQRIPVHPRIPSPDIGDIAQAGLSRSSDAPNWFLPNLYWARPERDFWPGAGMPVIPATDSLMPIPATDPTGAPPARLAMPIVQRGQAQLKARPHNTVWADWTDYRG